MRRLEREQDRMRGTVTYELAPNKWVTLDARAVEMMGLENSMRNAGVDYKPPTDRVPIIWHGQKVGTVPGDFEPLAIKSNNFFYDPRPGDFIRESDHWIANRTLGPGDLESVPGFVWNRGALQTANGMTERR